MKGIILVGSALLLAASLTGCATQVSEQVDPYEHTNRALFAFNLKFDRNLARPAAVFYNGTVPEIVRDGAHNFLDNLNSPVTFANEVLQGDGRHASQTLGRLVVNSTLGIGGLIDVAARLHIPRHQQDFGVTLGVYGVRRGPFLMLPLVGPSNPRDLIGSAVDVFFDPLTYVTWPGSSLHKLGLRGFEILDVRARNIDMLDQIERTSVDTYTAVRSFYLQHRDSEIAGDGPNIETLPDF